MADIRKNQNESINKAAEASRAGAREAANQTQDAVSAGVEGFKQSPTSSPVLSASRARAKR